MSLQGLRRGRYSPWISTKSFMYDFLFSGFDHFLLRRMTVLELGFSFFGRNSDLSHFLYHLDGAILSLVVCLLRWLWCLPSFEGMVTQALYFVE
jgi:hypothetical protein